MLISNMSVGSMSIDSWIVLPYHAFSSSASFCIFMCCSSLLCDKINNRQLGECFPELTLFILFNFLKQTVSNGITKCLPLKNQKQKQKKKQKENKKQTEKKTHKRIIKCHNMLHENRLERFILLSFTFVFITQIRWIVLEQQCNENASYFYRWQYTYYNYFVLTAFGCPGARSSTTHSLVGFMVWWALLHILQW